MDINSPFGGYIEVSKQHHTHVPHIALTAMDDTSVATVKLDLRTLNLLMVELEILKKSLERDGQGRPDDYNPALNAGGRE